MVKYIYMKGVKKPEIFLKQKISGFFAFYRTKMQLTENQ